MISEPEMDGAGQQAGNMDLVSHTDRPPLLGRFTARPWMWALGAVVVTSAIWAGALRATGYGHPGTPDLHGYAIQAAPCTNLTMQPLAGDLGSASFGQTTPLITRSPVLDHVSCQLLASVTRGDGWTTTYTMSVSVDLHKKADPAAEFDARSRSEAPADQAGMLLYLDDHERTSHPRGLGDRANLIAGDYRQSLYVRHGGAVFALTLLGSSEYDANQPPPPTSENARANRHALAETSAFRNDLAPTMRSLMRALTQPPSSS
jgi:hypothetical protein